jgi:CTP:molybdopterin cytidylyltransferase MocA
MLEQAHDQVLQPRFQSMGGHPIWLPKNIANQFLTEPQRLDLFLKNFAKRFVEARLSLCVTNINTPSDWENFIAKYQ